MSINSLPTSIVIYSTTATLATDSGAVRARFGYVDYTSTGVMSASSSGTLPALAGNGLTADAWRSTAGGTQWLACTIAEAAPASFMAIAGHSLNGGSAKPQYFDGADWQDLATGIIPTGDGPVVWEFGEQSAVAFRLYVTGAASAISIGTMQVGKTLKPTYGLPVGWKPPSLNPREEFTNSMTVGGQMLGRQVRRTGSAASFTLQYETYAFSRGEWQTFVQNTRLRPFFAWWTYPGSAYSEAIYGARGSVDGGFSTEQFVELSFAVEGTAL